MAGRIRKSSTERELQRLADHIALEELSLVKLQLLQLQLTSRASDEADIASYRSLASSIRCARYYQELLSDRIVLLSNEIELRNDERLVWLNETLDALDRSVGLLLELLLRRSHLARTRPERDSEQEQLLTHLLGALWGLIESYEARRTSYKTIWLSDEAASLMEFDHPIWLERLISTTTFCRLALEKRTGLLKEAEFYINKIMSFIRMTSSAPPPEPRPPTGNRKSTRKKSNRTSPRLFY